MKNLTTHMILYSAYSLHKNTNAVWESIRLEWENIDFMNNVITISTLCSIFPKWRFDEETKNTSSMSSIKIGQDLIDILNCFCNW